MSNDINLEHLARPRPMNGAIVANHSFELSDDYGVASVELSLEEDDDVAYSPEYLVALAMYASEAASDMLSYAVDKKLVYLSGLECSLDPDVVTMFQDRYAERITVHSSESHCHADLIDQEDESE